MRYVLSLVLLALLPACAVRGPSAEVTKGGAKVQGPSVAVAGHEATIGSVQAGPKGVAVKTAAIAPVERLPEPGK